VTAILLGGSAASPAEAQPCTPWQWVNPLPQGNHLNAVTFGGGRWVAVGDLGTVLTSDDGASWRLERAGTTTDLYAVTWGDDGFVAVGDEGIVMRSQDGSSWSYVRSMAWPLFAVASNGDRYVTVGYVGQIYYSDDAVTWAWAGPVTLVNLYAVIWDGSRFVAGGGGAVGSTSVGAILTSADGALWRSVSSVGFSEIAWNGSVYVGNGGYVEYPISISSDLVTWEPGSLEGVQRIRGVAWGGSLFAAIGNQGELLTSETGREWHRVTVPAGDLRDVAWGGGDFVVVGSDGLLLVSPDGSTWTEASSGPRFWVSAVAWNGELFLAVGFGSAAVLTSPDGVVWLQHEVAELRYVVLNDLVWAGEQFVAVGDNGAIATSSDGLSWQRRESGTTRHLSAVAWNGHRLVAVGQDICPQGGPSGFCWPGVGERIVVSDDGETWIPAQIPEGIEVFDVTWAGDRWVAVGSPHVMLTSADGLSWSVEQLDPNIELGSVIWTGDRLVAAGSFGSAVYERTSLVAVTSRGGSLWHISVLPPGRGVGPIVWTGWSILALEAGGVLESFDGLAWSRVSLPPSQPRYALVAAGPAALVAGEGGTILRRECGTTGHVRRRLQRFPEPTPSGRVRIERR
jgi:hypothetical protein